MNDDGEQTHGATLAARSTGAGSTTASSASITRRQWQESLFWGLWHACTAFLVFSLLLLAYSAAWEILTQRYLKGFSDAIVSANSTPAEKVQMILNWMSGPAANDTDPSPAGDDRDPEHTLNYASLLAVCGTATNAFINLADVSGLQARRLLLLDSHGSAVHVVAEVLIGGRWVVVDPAFRFIPRAHDGAFLTQEQLSEPATFSEATRGVPNYLPAYNYQSTSHIHLSRVPYFGRPFGRMLDVLIPGWSGLPKLSLLLERRSLAFLVVSIILVLCGGIFRAGLRWYGQSWLGVQPLHVHRRLARARTSFFEIQA